MASLPSGRRFKFVDPGADHGFGELDIPPHLRDMHIDFPCGDQTPRE